MVTPSYCLNIADELEKQGIDRDGCSLRIGIFGAEPWSNEMRREIEQRMGIDADGHLRLVGSPRPRRRQ